MNEKVLKKIIKNLVRESLSEIFAEMQLEKIVESVIVKQKTKNIVKSESTFSVREALKETPKSNKPLMVEQKKQMLDKLKISDDTWSNIYTDTAQSNNPILSNQEESAATEEVPESVLESMGLMRDYSKFVNSGNISSESDEWKKKREERAKILNESIKRP